MKDTFIIIFIAAFVTLSYRLIKQLRIRYNNLRTLRRLATIPISPTTTVFGFDFNGVIVKSNIKRMVKIILFDLPRIDFLLMLSPLFWYFAIKLMRSQMVVEHVFDQFSKHSPHLAAAKPIIIRLINSQVLNQDLVPILEKLKEQGYTLYIISNNWQSVFEQLIKKFPELSFFFDGFYLPTAENGYAHKPQLQYYQGFEKYLKMHGKTYNHIIFIDENYTNITTANKIGWYGIIFSSARNLARRLKHITR
jgi:phosphoglycolate phosphatase-like HAD superfamily hydrolase